MYYPMMGINSPGLTGGSHIQSRLCMGRKTLGWVVWGRSGQQNCRVRQGTFWAMNYGITSADWSIQRDGRSLPQQAHLCAQKFVLVHSGTIFLQEVLFPVRSYKLTPSVLITKQQGQDPYTDGDWIFKIGEPIVSIHSFKLSVALSSSSADASNFLSSEIRRSLKCLPPKLPLPLSSLQASEVSLSIEFWMTWWKALLISVYCCAYVSRTPTRAFPGPSKSTTADMMTK